MHLYFYANTIFSTTDFESSILGAGAECVMRQKTEAIFLHVVLQTY